MRLNAAIGGKMLIIEMPHYRFTSRPYDYITTKRQDQLEMFV